MRVKLARGSNIVGLPFRAAPILVPQEQAFVPFLFFPCWFTSIFLLAFDFVCVFLYGFLHLSFIRFIFYFLF